MFIPMEMARCPECGGELWAVRVTPDEVDVTCLKESEVPHRWRKSDWADVMAKAQEVVDVD